MNALEARWKQKRSPKDSGANRALGLCGSPDCDEGIADLEDFGPPGAEGQCQVTIRPGYIDAAPQPRGYDAPYLVFSVRWRDHRPMRSKERTRALRRVDRAAEALGLPGPSAWRSHDGLPPTEPPEAGASRGRLRQVQEAWLSCCDARRRKRAVDAEPQEVWRRCALGKC